MKLEPKSNVKHEEVGERSEGGGEEDASSKVAAEVPSAPPRPRVIGEHELAVGEKESVTDVDVDRGPRRHHVGDGPCHVNASHLCELHVVCRHLQYKTADHFRESECGSNAKFLDRSQKVFTQRIATALQFRSLVSCFRCGYTGHKARECLNYVPVRPTAVKTCFASLDYLQLLALSATRSAITQGIVPTGLHPSADCVPRLDTWPPLAPLLLHSIPQSYAFYALALAM
ncbi:hypothetical protein Pelo_4802 [Pelomyxa schiedti]|nr:hypothetical protein Pelo_4802 [Pelomyxa schiedti]